MFEDRIKQYAFLILMAALLFQLIFSEGGVASYIKLRKEIKTIDVSLRKLEQENVQLLDEIGKLQKDDQYLEEYARKKFGLLRDGEKLIRVDK